MKHSAMKAFCSLLFACIVLSQPALAQTKSSASIPTADLIQPADLVASLRKPTTARPLVLQVGSHVLFAESHIPGSEYAGSAGDESGLQALRQRVAAIPKDTFIVLYCGCCPWTRCPNIAPAYDQLRTLGFTHLKVLYIADNFGANWVDQGYPIAKGR